MKNIYLWATPSVPINLIEGDKMPVKPKAKTYGYLPPSLEEEGGWTIEGGYDAYNQAVWDYELALQAAKASSVPIQNREVAKRLISQQIASLNPVAAGPTFIQPGAIYNQKTMERATP